MIKKYHIITIGCQMNKSDSARIASYFDKMGLREAENRPDADIAVINTCGVRESAENRLYGLIPRLRKENPDIKVALTGCLVGREDIIKKLKSKVDFWLPIVDLPKWYKYMPVGTRPATSGESREYLCIPPKLDNGCSAFVPLGNGCDNFCAYCVVPAARGGETYRPAEEILAEVDDLVKRGYKEINLIAQNVNSYNYNANAANGMRMPRITNYANLQGIINFTGLLRAVNDMPGEFWVRFSSSHPKDISGELIEALPELEKVCEHIHLPVQAGNNEVLKRMNRNYTVEKYKSLISAIRKAYSARGYVMPSVTTDVIVGFPGETRKQFEDTVKLFHEIKFDMAYIAQYSPRPGTAAHKMKDDVSPEEKKRRDKELTAALKQTALENNQAYIGKTVGVLLDGRNRKGEWHGRTRTNKSVAVEKTKNKPSFAKAAEGRRQAAGEFINVKITKAKDFGLTAEGEIFNSL